MNFGRKAGSEAQANRWNSLSGHFDRNKVLVGKQQSQLFFYDSIIHTWSFKKLFESMWKILKNEKNTETLFIWRGKQKYFRHNSIPCSLETRQPRGTRLMYLKIFYSHFFFIHGFSLTLALLWVSESLTWIDKYLSLKEI